MGNLTIHPPRRQPLREPAQPEPDSSTRAFLLRSSAALGAALLLPRGRALAQGAQPDPRSAEPIGVLFPELGEPFRKVFLDIVAGIEAAAPQRVRAWPLAPAHNLAELSAALRRSGAKVVVALGRQGLKAAAVLDPATGVVVGGVSSVPGGERQFGVCLTPDPALLFARLKTLLPAVRRVAVVYNPELNEWLMRGARAAAAGLGLELVTHEARDLAAAARLYQASFAGADSRRDALWLPIDATTIDETATIPLVLRESWNRAVPVFSSSLAHVNKGVLFSLYPNNAELGRTLGTLAASLLGGEPVARGVTPLRDVYAALNLRTASHFGVALDARTQRSFNYLYPPP